MSAPRALGRGDRLKEMEARRRLQEKSQGDEIHRLRRKIQGKDQIEGGGRIGLRTDFFSRFSTFPFFINKIADISN